MLLKLTEQLSYYFSKSFRQNFCDYCRLETVDGESTLVLSDGSLVTLVKVEGFSQIIGEPERQAITESLRGLFTPPLKDLGHFLEILFEVDPNQSPGVIADALKPSYTTLKNLRLDLEDIFDEKTRRLMEIVIKEESYLALWTTTELLSKDELKKERETNGSKPFPFQRTSRSLNPYACASLLRVRHDAFVQSTLSEIESSGFLLRKLSSPVAAATIRRTIQPQFASPDWQPSVPGQRLPMRVRKTHLSDEDGFFYQPLNEQMITVDAVEINIRQLRIGSTYYAAAFMNGYPSDPKPFDVLLRKILAAKGLPFRVTFRIEPGGLAAMRFKTMANAYLAWMSEDNRRIKEAFDELRETVTNQEDVDVLLRINFLTWVDGKSASQALEILNQRVSIMIRAIEGWGGCQVRQISGDVKESFFSSTIGTTRKNVGTACALPLKEALKLLPYRPASIWEQGAILFRTPDGKLMPYQPFSKEQESNVNIICGAQRYGKSVLLATMVLSLILRAGNERLPHITILDVGQASAGVISLIQEALPSSRRHLATSSRLTLDGRMYINPFDLPLGHRSATPVHRSFLVNLLCLLNTPLDSQNPDIGVPELAGLLIDVAYTEYNEKKPKIYELNVHALVDEKIRKNGIVLPENPSWFEVADALFACGDYHGANLAQKYAVPLLTDLSRFIMDERVLLEFGKLIPGGRGETIVHLFTRTLTSIARELPILAHPTNIDFGEARVISFDLQDVAKGHGAQDRKRTSIFYMLARFIGGQHFYATDDLVYQALPSYRKFQAQRVQELREDYKMLFYDELHRANCEQVARQIELDIREGGKMGVGVTLSSQQETDFSSVMLQLSTSIFILGVSQGAGLNQIAQTFELSQTALEALRDKCRGPGPYGSNVLAKFRTRLGNFTQLLTLTLSSAELWAFTTTKDDVAIRDRLYKKMSPARARKVLARAYPKGRAEDDVEERKRRMGCYDEESTHGIIESIVHELVEQANVWGY